jgi:superfamily II DNA or RNA helicase
MEDYGIFFPQFILLDPDKQNKNKKTMIKKLPFCITNTTYEFFTNNIDFFNSNFDLVNFDEGHSLKEPRFYKSSLQLKRGQVLNLFTATLFNNNTNEIKKIFNVIFQNEEILDLDDNQLKEFIKKNRNQIHIDIVKKKPTKKTTFYVIVDNNDENNYENNNDNNDSINQSINITQNININEIQNLDDVIILSMNILFENKNNDVKKSNKGKYFTEIYKEKHDIFLKIKFVLNKLENDPKLYIITDDELQILEVFKSIINSKYKNYKIFEYNGETKKADVKDNIITEFQLEKIAVLFLSGKGALGLNIPKCSTMFIINPLYNIFRQMQVSDSIHRFDSQIDVVVYVLYSNNQVEDELGKQFINIKKLLNIGVEEIIFLLWLILTKILLISWPVYNFF